MVLFLRDSIFDLSLFPRDLCLCYWYYDCVFDLVFFRSSAVDRRCDLDAVGSVTSCGVADYTVYYRKCDIAIDFPARQR